MKFVFVVAAGVAFMGVACAQTSSASKPKPAPQGIPEDWDVRTMVQSLKSQAEHLKPILDQIQPESWVSKGAPAEYVTQWKSSEAELLYLMQSSDAFSKQPDRLPLALDTYFRMQSMDTMVVSLIEGIRKYQNPAVADLVRGIMNENSGNRDRLREYIRELATQKEQEFQVVDKEAQRCRGMLMRESNTGTRKNK